MNLSTDPVNNPADNPGSSHETAINPQASSSLVSERSDYGAEILNGTYEMNKIEHASQLHACPHEECAEPDRCPKAGACVNSWGYVNLPAAAQPIVTEEMVTRFLGWKLPEDFYPDCGISFKPLGHPNGWPVGTNLFTDPQARAMLEYVLQDAPIAAQPSVPDISDDDLMRVFWKHFRSFRSSASAVTYTKWKDGIDIDVMSTPMLAYSRELLTMLAPTPPVDEQAQRPMEWPTMPPSKGGSGAAFDSGYAEGWSKCLMDCKNVVRQAQQEDQL